MIFDEKSVRERLLDDDALIEKVVNTFIRSLPEHIIALKRHIRDKDFDAIRQRGHTIKGSSGSAGALEIQKIAQDIELAGKNTEMDKTVKLAASLESAFENFKALF